MSKKISRSIFNPTHHFVCLCLDSLAVMPVLTTDHYFIYSIFFLADLSYVGFVLLGDFVDINGDK